MGAHGLGQDALEAAYVIGASVAHLCPQRLPSGRGWVQVEARAQQQQHHELSKNLQRQYATKKEQTK